MITGGDAVHAEGAVDAWAAAMRAGDFARAWAISDRSLASLRRCDSRKHDGPRHLQRIWRGEELSGRKVLVRCYHGLGDTIQFIRFARPLRQIAREVVVWCQPELVPLISHVAGVDLAIPLHEGAPDIDFDADVEIMEIPHAIRATHDQIAMQRPYLKCSRRRIPRPMQQKLSIGLFWRTSDWDVRRSFPIPDLRTLALPGVQLFSLQRGAAMHAAAEIGAIDISADDLQTLAGRLCALDLLICPDSMIAHLSGALGCRTWVILPTDCDWRWPDRGSRTFWYPTVRLFHQRVETGWSGVFADVREAVVTCLKRGLRHQGWAGASTPAVMIARGPDRDKSGTG